MEYNIYSQYGGSKFHPLAIHLICVKSSTFKNPVWIFDNIFQN